MDFQPIGGAACRRQVYPLKQISPKKMGKNRMAIMGKEGVGASRCEPWDNELGESSLWDYYYWIILYL